MGAGEAPGSIDVKSSVMERVLAIHAQRLTSEGGGNSPGQALPGTVTQAPVMIRQPLPSLRPAAQRGRRLAAGLCAVALLGLAGFSVLRNMTDQETTGRRCSRTLRSSGRRKGSHWPLRTAAAELWHR